MYNEGEKWPPERPITFKPARQPRQLSIREFEVDDGGTIIAIFQGNRGMNPELDIIVKYIQREKRLRTPQHIHWAIDLLIKKEHKATLTKSFVEYLTELYDRVGPFCSEGDRLKRVLISDTEQLTQETFQPLNKFGEYSIEFTCYILELIAIQEKTSNPSAFMFRNALSSILEDKEIFQIVSAATYR